MATFGELPFGIKDAKMTPLPSGTLTDLPRIRSLEVSLVSDSADLTGDDGTVAVHTFNLHVEGSIEAGGVNAAAIAIMVGSTVTSVAGPPAKKTVSITNTTNGGYFKLEGQMLADDAGDFHIVIYKCKVTNGPNFTGAGGEFMLTGAEIQGVQDSTGKILDLVWNDTAAAIA